MDNTQNRVQPNEQSIPCISCEKIVRMEFYPDSTLESIMHGAINGGVHCSSAGNYGSTIHDMNGKIHFVMCDECLFRNSYKMLIVGHSAPPNNAICDMENLRDHIDTWNIEDRRWN